MKIYNEIRINIESGHVVSEDAFEYDGPVSLCGGSGGSTTTTVDPVYNAGLLALSQENQDWASKLMGQYFYGADYDPTKEVTGFFKSDGTFVDMTEYDGIRWIHGKGLSPTGADTGLLRDDAGRVTGDPDLNGLVFTLDQKWKQADGTDLPITTTTMGAIKGYTEDDANTSGAEYAQNAINAQQSLLAGETSASASQTALAGATADSQLSLLPSQTDAARTTAEYATATNLAATSLIPAQTDASRSTAELTTLQNYHNMFLTPYQTDAARTTAELTTANNFANLGLVDQRAAAEGSGYDLTTAQNLSNLGLVDEREGLERSNIDTSLLTNTATQERINAQRPVVQQFYQQALQGVDPNQRADQAQVDATLAFRNSGRDLRQQAAMSGINPSSGRYLSALSGSSLDQARAVGGARTQARNNAETENFARLTSAMQGAV